jgi:hypothetical protein
LGTAVTLAQCLMYTINNTMLYVRAPVNWAAIWAMAVLFSPLGSLCIVVRVWSPAACAARRHPGAHGLTRSRSRCASSGQPAGCSLAPETLSLAKLPFLP